MAKNNPNKVNQYTDPDPRQALFLKYYLDPKSETFSNALQSGIKAGYSEEYSTVILHKDLAWLSDSVKTGHIVELAEKNLEEFLAMDTNNVIDDGENIIVKKDTGLVRVKSDMTKFALERLKKEKYSARTELTGKDGKDLPTPILGGTFVQDDNSHEESGTNEVKD